MYIGDPDELEEAKSRPNVVAVTQIGVGTAVTFKVHGPEGTRTYFYPGLEQTVETALELLEFL